MRVHALLAAVLLAACAAETGAPASTGVFSIARGPCFGFCPIYTATVTADDRLVFNGERFVAAEGPRQKALPEGSFARLVEIAEEGGFASFDARYPNDDGSNCPSQATDLPSVDVAITSSAVTHSVSFYQGCFGFEGRERLEAMIADFDAVLALDEWIGPREDFMGGER